jgi:FkbM family methyltransferase
MDMPAGLPWLNAPPGSQAIERLGRSFLVDTHPQTLAAARAFATGREDATLQFLDAALPACDRVIDFGAYLGLTALYAATAMRNVFAFEPSPGNFAILAENVARNVDLAPRIHLFRQGVADRDDEATLYAGAATGSGPSIFPTVERDQLLHVEPSAVVTLRDATTVLREIGVDSATLLKIDIAGAEYVVLPAIADLLAARRPYLHVSFYPFNVVLGTDPYLNAITRMRRALQVAEAVAPYRYVHLFSNDNWFCVRAADRMDFLRQYLLRPKQVQRIASEQYGFIDAVGFSDAPLPSLHGG